MTAKSVLQIPGADDERGLEIELLPNGTYQLTEWTKQVMNAPGHIRR
jgi:hypothetical protein